MIDIFDQLFMNRYQEARKRRDAGRYFLGWICIFVPEEIIQAAGIQPFKVMGKSESTPIGDAYVYSNICSMVRSCLQELFTNNYAFLDGFVASASCDHIRRLYDIWNYYYGDNSFTDIIGVPHKADNSSIEYYRDELIRFKSHLESHFRVKITDESLWHSIATYNRTRILLMKLYDFRKREDPLIKGSDVLRVIRAGLGISRDRYNEMLEDLLEKLPLQRPSQMDGPRILLTGGELDKPEFIEIIEDLGGIVVADDLCVGTRYFEGLVDNQGDPIEALAKRYLSQPVCPHINPASERFTQLKEKAHEYKVDGIIYQTIKFCDLNAGIFPVIKDGLKEVGIPVLRLDREYSMAGIGQLKTRIQAFLESLTF